MKLFVVFATLLTATDAFVVQPIGARASTRIFIDDSIAELIDNALYRQQHHTEIEKKWEEQNKKMFENEFLHEVEVFEEEVSQLSEKQLYRDKMLAQTDPEAYCKERCVSLGECEVFEDFYHLTPGQVMLFCKECVLADTEEPCDIPDFLGGGFGP